jgi:hypothetical protein
LKEEWWVPESTITHSDVDRQIRALNIEAYPADLFGKADDLLMFSLFAAKQATRPKRKKRFHSVIPEQVTNHPMLTKDEGRKAANICEPLLSGNDASMEEVRRVVSELKREIALFQSPEQQWVPCLRQCAVYFFLVPV